MPRILLFSIFLRPLLCSAVANIWLSPVAPLRQYHMQDGSGSYRYAFTGPHHAKAESSLNGITQGGYSYIDANGVLQTVAYTADDLNGFRVSASNLPQPAKNELQEAPQAEEPEAGAGTDRAGQLGNHREWQQERNALAYKFLPTTVLGYQQQQQQQQQPRHEPASKTAGQLYAAQESPKNPFLLSRSEAARIEVPRPDPSLSKATTTTTTTTTSNADDGREESGNDRDQILVTRSIAADNVNGLQPGKLLPLPAPYVLPVMPYRLLHSSLRHTQDSLGQYDYSYTGDTSAKSESRSIDGTTRGAYSYIDANGLLQQVHYVADHNGFRVLATNLPEA